MDEIKYNGMWWNYRSRETGRYDGPVIRGSILAYSVQSRHYLKKEKS